MSREIRKVPENWEHPQKIDKYNEKLTYKPLLRGSFNNDYKDWKKDLKEWYRERKEFEKGKEFSYEDDNGKIKFYSKKHGNLYEDWAGEPPFPPNPDHYMPKGKWYQLFESVSEGTPISPPFASKKELVEWLKNNKDFWGDKWNEEAAKDIIRTGYAPSMIFDRRGFYEPHQQYLLKKSKN